MNDSLHGAIKLSEASIVSEKMLIELKRCNVRCALKPELVKKQIGC